MPQQAHSLEALEITLEIGLQIVNVLDGQRVHRLSLRRLGEFTQQFGQLGLGQRFVLAVIAVGVIGVPENLDQVGLGQQPHPHRRDGSRVRRRLQGEARDQAGGFAPAFRVDVADEVDFLAGEISQQRRGALACQRRDQVRLAGLAGAEDADAHGSLHSLLQPSGLGDEAAEFLGQPGLFLADPLGVVVQPGQKFGADLLQGMAGVAEGGVGGGHDGFAGDGWLVLSAIVAQSVAAFGNRVNQCATNSASGSG